MERFQEVENCDLLVIAGEASGDEHAGVLVEKLKARNPNLRVAALGGRHLAKAEAVMLEDLVAHSRVGIWEVIKHLPVFLKLIDETFQWIEKNKPRMVLFVDFVGFNLEIAKRLYNKKLSQKSGGPVKLYFYVSPQIWAWKANRRFKIAKWIDRLGAIFPFEPAYYKDTTLDVEFVGHPFVNDSYQNPLSYDPQGVILLLPGSRTAIVKKHLPVLWQAFQNYQKQNPQAKVAAYYANEPLRKQMIEITGGKLTLIPAGTPIKVTSVICTAGTISLACALAGIPGMVIYKTDPLTFAYGKSVYKKKYLGMSNILLDRPLMREILQDDVTPENLALELTRIKNDPTALEIASKGAAELKLMLSHPTKRNAVEWVESGLKVT